jgi:flagellar biosynthesis/type III secretory pathway protein FliH
VVPVGPAAQVIVQAGGHSQIVPDRQAVEAQASYDSGFVAGHQAASRELRERIAAIEAENRSLAEALPASLTRYLTELEGQLRTEIVNLALLLAEVLLGEVVPPERLCAAALQEAFAQILSRDGLRLRLSSRVLGLVQASAAAASLAGVRLVPDPGLADGDIILETPEEGVVDASLTTRIRALGARLRHVQPPGPGGQPGERPC